MSNLNKHFREVAGSPKPFHAESLFGSRIGESSYTSGSSDLLQQLIDQVNSQTSEVQSLVGAITGKSGGGSAIENVLGGTAFGGSALGASPKRRRAASPGNRFSRMCFQSAG